MSDAIFPVMPGLSWGTDWAPKFNTKILTATSGKEYRSSLMVTPIYTFKLQYEFLRAASRQELQTMMNFFLARRGAFDSFLYSHPDDCSVTDQLIGVANGAQRQFQLMRGFGSDYAEPVQNINQLLNVKVNGIAKAAGSDYTVTSSGLVVFGVTPAAGSVTWSGSYYYRCRFTKDELPFHNLMQAVHSLKALEMTGSLGKKI